MIWATFCTHQHHGCNDFHDSVWNIVSVNELLELAYWTTQKQCAEEITKHWINTGFV